MAAVRRAAWERVQQKLKHADHSSLRAAEQSADGLRAFFQKCKDGTPAFAEVALGWKSKRLVIWERMPFTEPNQHRTYLDEQFQQKVFSQSELAAVLESCGSDFRQAIDGIENQLLVDVRQDLEDFPAIVLPPTPQEAQAEFERLAQAIANDSALDVGIEVGKLATATAIESVALAVLSKLGVSSTILGGGAAAGTATLGASVVAAILIDYLLGRVIDWFYDPQANLTQKINQSLDEIRGLLIDGDAEAHDAFKRLKRWQESDPDERVRVVAELEAEKLEAGGRLGLLYQFHLLHEARSTVRAAALRRMIFGEEEP